MQPSRLPESVWKWCIKLWWNDLC